MKMKTARNALKGYTYQNYFFVYLLSKMDTERNIEIIISEATHTQNFDDFYIKLSSGVEYRIQVKNYDKLNIQDLKIDKKNDMFIIKSNKNSYNPEDNHIVIVNSDLLDYCTTKVFGLPAFKIGEINVIPFPEKNISDELDKMFESEGRELQIIQFANELICSEKFEIHIDNLPPIIRFSTDLEQNTVLIREFNKPLSNGITFIEGKAGVRKSHYANEIIEQYPNSIIYRFWISSKDSQLTARLRFDVFLEQIGIEVFNSPKSFSIHELIAELEKTNKILIVDGLDHVENYNPIELDKFIDFFELLNTSKVSVLLLSRPLRRQIIWNKLELTNWSMDETFLYLYLTYGINDYHLKNNIYKLTKGYPIIIYYVAEHYKKRGELGFDNPISDISDYYDKLLTNIKVKELLGVFANNNSFFTYKELGDFSGAFFSSIHSFIEDYPYLFNIEVNRVSLFHDSFNTYLRNSFIKSPDLSKIIINKVCESLYSGEVQYMARVSSFMLDESVISKLISQYSDFDFFEKLINKTIDFNSLFSFYDQLRYLLECRPNILNVYQYYSFALIYQIVSRNDLIGYENHIYQVLLYLNKQDDIENSIFSSGIIWNLYLTCKYKSDKYLKRFFSNTMYGANQIDDAIRSILDEDSFYECFDKEPEYPQILDKLNQTDIDTIEKRDLIIDYLVSIWIHKKIDYPLFMEINEYIENNDDKAINKKLFNKYLKDRFWVESICKAVRYKLHELGFFEENNIFRNYSSVKEIINNKACEGSFNVSSYLLPYIRLSNHDNKSIDINNINYFWMMYYQRKDYSVHTIDVALYIFEKHGFLDEDDSVCLINRLMNQSEKGIRHLLATYINLKGPEFTNKLVETNKIYDNNLKINWLEISPENINRLPKCFINEIINELISIHYNTKHIDGWDIKEALKSRYSKMFVDALDYYDIAVYGGLPENEINILESAGVQYLSDESSSLKKEYVPFEHGYIGEEDFDYIKKSGMSALECSRYPDGSFSCLPYVEIYDFFDKVVIKKEYLAIIHQALFARVIDKQHIGNWNEIIGNIPNLIDHYDIEIEWNKLFCIFVRFLDLSEIYYPDSLLKLIKGDSHNA